MKNYKQHAQWLILALAIILPFFIIRFFPKFYHSSDMDDFLRWSQAWGMGWRNIYINCERCNYPFIGTLLSGGMMDALNVETFARLANRFRYYLAVVDAFNVLLVWILLKKLQVRNTPLWAGIIGLLPSSWLGSSVWGQIDGVGQFLILLFFLLLIWFNQEKRSIKQFYIFVALAGLLFSCMLLTKQLIYFSVFALGLIFLANVLIYSRKFSSVFIAGVVTLVAFVLPVIIIDLNLNLKPPYFSHLQYVLATGSAHANIISSVGFNVWVFFSKNLLGSSHVPIPIQIGSQTLFSVTPYPAGIFLFILISIALGFLFFRQIHKYQNNVASQFVLSALVYLALVNLSFNLTFTGTHERYLYHFYPFMIIACLGYFNRSGFFNLFTLTSLLAGSIIYGVFLFGYLIRWVRPSSLAILESMSAFHLILFGYLTYLSIRQFNVQQIDLTSSL